MLHRLIRQQPTSQYFGSITKGCTTRYCRCGHAITQSKLHNVQRRGAASEPAPSTRSKRRAVKRGPVTHEEWKNLREEGERARKFELVAEQEREYKFRISLANEQLLRNKHIDEQRAVAFVEQFTKLQAAWPPTLSGNLRVTTSRAQLERDEAYARLFHESEFEAEDITVIASALLHESMDHSRKAIGTSLLFEASYVGNEYATIRLMGSAYNQSASNPAALRYPRLAPVRNHLKQIHSAPAKVLYGRIAKLEGDHDLAIRLWTDAMEESQQAARQRRETQNQQALAVPTERNTSSPWIDLAETYLKRGQSEKAKWAIDIGCDLDDPTSHYHAALYHKIESKFDTSNSKWLYHISKAAASGLPKAMHELGCWYFVTAWPYLEDEVPDSLRPTPFDAYPPQKGVTIEETKESAVFESATFPHTVEGRLRMALLWLGLAWELNYAPSCLMAARIYLSKTVPEDMAMPAAALKLRRARYRYKSKAEYDAAPPAELAAVTEVPNPFYGMEEDGHSLALHHIRQIFFASEACKEAPGYLSMAKKRNQDKKSSKEATPQDSMWLSRNYSKWLEYKASYVHFMDMNNGLLYDENAIFDIPNLLAEAKRICDKEKWEIRDDDGRLLYRPNLRAKGA